MSLTVHGSVGFAETTASSSPSITNASGQPIAAHSVILLFVLNASTSAAVSASSVSGGGLTWQRLVSNLAFNSTDATVQHCTMEVWWATNPSLIAGSGLTATVSYGINSPPSCLAFVSIEGANTSAPLDASGRFTNTNTSATVGAVPSVTVGTTATNVAGFQFYGITGSVTGNASQPAGWTLDPANGQASTPATFLEAVHKIFASAQANATSTWSGTDKRWGIMSFGVVQATPADNVSIDQTLLAPTQASAAKEVEKAAAAQTLFKPSQAVNAIEHGSAAIAMEFFTLIETAEDIELEPASIAQTLAGIVQEADVFNSSLDKVAIDQLLFAPIQEADVFNSSHDEVAIDQLLLAPIQEADASSEFAADEEAAIDQVLFGPLQEAHVYSDVIVGQIAQTFRRRFSAQVQVFADIAQTFRRRLVTNTASADITMQLLGFSQSARTRNIAFGTHPLRPGQSGINEPRMAHDPPISNAELEFFRVKAYARGVDGLVPPSVIAQRNLTSDRLPKSRPVVKPFPQRGKPK